MAILTLKNRVVDSIDVLPDGVQQSVCSCGGTQFRSFEDNSGQLYVTCPTCAAIFPHTGS